MFDLCFSGPAQNRKPPFWGRLSWFFGSAGTEISLISTDDTCLKFYYNHRREHLRSVLGDKLPDVLTGGKPVALQEHKGDRVKELAEQYQTLSRAERARLAKMLKGGAA